jgi:hypothetical protein
VGYSIKDLLCLEKSGAGSDWGLLYSFPEWLRFRPRAMPFLIYVFKKTRLLLSFDKQESQAPKAKAIVRLNLAFLLQLGPVAK